MKAIYDISKIKSFVLYILKESGGQMDFITLFKNMYFSQREYLVQYGKPIFKDSFRALRKGPVPSFTYMAFCSALDGYKDSADDIKEFNASFIVEEKDNVRYITAIEEPDLEELAPAEMRVIKKVMDANKTKTPQQLSEDSHDEAWKAAELRAQDDPKDNYMPLVSIARAGGANPQILNHIRQAQALENFCRE